MLDVLVKALSLVIIIGIGFGFKRLGWLTTAHFPIFSRLVLTVTLPAALITAFSQYEFHPALLVLTIASLAVNTFQQSVGYFLNRKYGRRLQSFAVLHSGGYNIGAFATPYMAAMMGPQVMLYTSMFDIGVAVGNAGVGYGWASSLVSPDGHGRLRSTLVALRNPVLVTYIALLALLVSGITLPTELIAFTSVIGAANPFLAMFMIGVGLELRLPRHTLKLAARFLLVRYLIVVPVAVACWFLIPGPDELRAVVCALWFAPLAAMSSAFTERLGLDVEASAFTTSVSILVGIVAIPLVLMLA